MSRKTRVLQKRFAVFCEGDTEYNYIRSSDLRQDEKESGRICIMLIVIGAIFYVRKKSGSEE